MAETPTGVTESRTPPRGGGGKLAPFLKKNKVAVAGAGGLGVLLYMSSKGKSGSGSSGSNANQLQSASDYLAASQAAQENALAADTSMLPGGVAPVDTGGGSYVAQGPSATTAPAVTVNQPPAVVNVNVPAQPTPKARPARKKKKPAAKPKQAHKTRPAPARKSGKHPHTRKRTASGHKKRSPVEVEAMVGAGAGLMIHGRHFPGASGYREHAPLRSSNGTVSRPVTIDFGGHTETHMVHGNGDRWTDNIAGWNPPSRGVPQELPGMNNANL